MIVVRIANCLISMYVSVFVGHHNKELTYLHTCKRVTMSATAIYTGDIRHSGVHSPGNAKFPDISVTFHGTPINAMLTGTCPQSANDHYQYIILSTFVYNKPNTACHVVHLGRFN